MSRLRELLTILAESPASANGKKPAAQPIESGANVVPNRFHLAHADGTVLSALAEIATHAPELLKSLPAKA